MLCATDTLATRSIDMSTFGSLFLLWFPHVICTKNYCFCSDLKQAILWQDGNFWSGHVKSLFNNTHRCQNLDCKECALRVSMHCPKLSPGFRLFPLKHRRVGNSFLAKLFNRANIHVKQNTFSHVKTMGTNYFQNILFCCEIFDQKKKKTTNILI